jgi:hypothetical protein
MLPLPLLRRVENLAAGGEVGPLDIPAELRDADVFVIQQLDQRRAHLAEVVRRDVGRHAHGDAGRAVDQQIRDPRRQDDRLGFRPVVVGPEMDRGLLDLGEHFVADAREPALRVAHGRRAVAVERPEITGAVHERIAQRERLRHADERLVQRHVAMRVVAAHHVADDRGALAVLRVGGQALLPHRKEDAALYRLHPVPDVRERPSGNNRERVIEVARLSGFVERDGGRPGAAAPAAPALIAVAGIEVVEERRLAARPALSHEFVLRVSPGS